jgi:hypothetical protein
VAVLAICVETPTIPACCSPKMLPSRQSLHIQWLASSLLRTRRRVKVLVLRIAFAKACYFPIMLFDFYSSSAGPVIPVVKALQNTHDRQLNLAASSVARSYPPTWHVFVKQKIASRFRKPWQKTVLHPSKNSKKLTARCCCLLRVMFQK